MCLGHHHLSPKAVSSTQHLLNECWLMNECMMMQGLLKRDEHGSVVVKHWMREQGKRNECFNQVSISKPVLWTQGKDLTRTLLICDTMLISPEL